MDYNEIFRLSAILYSHDSNGFGKGEIIKGIIESFFVKKKNHAVPFEEIDLLINDEFGIYFAEEELWSIISSSNVFDINYIRYRVDSDNQPERMISLKNEKYQELILIDDKANIHKFITEYFEAHSEIIKMNMSEFTSLIERFLYHIFVQNISFGNGLFNESYNYFSQIEDERFLDKEKKIINSFLDFNDTEKNKTIFNIGSLALDFISITGNGNNEELIGNIADKVVFLDTNILFRLLGINGERRKVKITTFIEKCKRVNQKILVTDITINEFLSSIKNSLRDIKEIQHKIIYPDYFENATIKDYFIEKQKRSSLTTDIYYELKYQELKTLMAQYDIQEFKYNEEMIIESSVDNIGIIESLFKIKNTYYQATADGKNISLIKALRGKDDLSFKDIKYYFITADGHLIDWDKNNAPDYPIAIYPSSWLSIILRYVTRTDDDYNAFVSFIKNTIVPKHTSQEKVIAMFKGISEIVEDINAQRIIYDHIFETKSDYILREERVENITLLARDNAVELLKLDMVDLKNQVEVLKKTNEFEIENQERNRELIDTLQNHNDTQDEKIKKLKLKKINEATKEWYIKLILTVIFLCISFALLLTMLFWKEWSWNVIAKGISYIENNENFFLAPLIEWVILAPVSALLVFGKVLYENLIGKNRLSCIIDNIEKEY